MSRLKRFVVVACLVLLSIPLLSAVAVAGAVAHSGLVKVEVEERGVDGVDFFIPVPALAVELAIAIVPLIVPNHELDDLRREAEPWAPALLRAAEVFEDLPDVTLVEVLDGDEFVRVRKVGSKLEVEVDEPDVQVRVSLPVRTVRRSMSWILGA